METGHVKWTIMFVIVVLLIGLVPTAVCAAESNELITIDFKDLDVNAAIEAMFRNTGRNFAIDPEAKDIRVGSLSFKGVPFDTALKNLLKSAGLTYRMDANIYLISKKATSAFGLVPGAPTAPTSDPLAAVDVTTTQETIIDKVPLSNAGASEILNMMGGNTGSTTSGFGSFGGGSGGGGGFGGGGFGGGGSGFGGGSSYGGGGGGGYGGGSSYGGGGGGYGGGSSYGGGGGYGGGGSRSW